MGIFDAAEAWIAGAWQEMGYSFSANDLPVAQFAQFDVDDLSYPFKHLPLRTWRLLHGKLLADPAAKLQRVPYIAFCIDETAAAMGIQVQWAPRCGYGLTIRFRPSGAVAEQKMHWVS